jgi:CheY-like chemotaxis protein
MPNVSQTVLLVERADEVRSLLALLLTRGGYRVLEASGSGEATALLVAHHPAVVLISTSLQSDAAIFLRLRRQRASGAPMPPVIVYAPRGPVRVDPWALQGGIAATVGDAMAAGRDALLARTAALARRAG